MTLQLEIRYKPHLGQSEFHDSPTRFRILACGRRWGKTKSGANEAIKQAITSGTNSVGFCVAPTYWHTQKQWAEFLLYCPRELIHDINRADKRITLIGNRNTWFKSADNPDSLRSEGLDWLWMDEGGEIKQEAWTLALRPALMDKKGVAWFTGTPKGMNWYHILWAKGQDPKETEYRSWTYPTSNNPYIDPDEIEEARKQMPELAFRQEILGEFIPDVGTVFRGVDEIVTGSLQPPAHGQTYVAGCDLAKYEDYTVLCVLDQKGHLVHFDRWSEYNWVYQRKLLSELVSKYNNARLLIDSTGVGDPVFDELSHMNLNVQGFKFTNASKEDLIENLAVQIEKRSISIPNIPELVNELKLFGREKMPGGTTRYHAPEGYHDDCVIALALAVWQISRPTAGIDFLR